MTRTYSEIRSILILLLPAALLLAWMEASLVAGFVHAGWLNPFGIAPLFARDFLWSAASLLALLGFSTTAAVLIRAFFRLHGSFDDRRLALWVIAALAAILASVAMHHAFEVIQAEASTKRLAFAGFGAWMLLAIWLVGRNGRGRDGVIRLPALASLVAFVPLVWGIRVDSPDARSTSVPTMIGAPIGEALVDSIVLVTLDTTRLDAVGYSGSKRTSTPVLDRLAAEGAAYTNATTPIPLTLPSHTSMMTGLPPWQHGVVVNGARIPSQLRTVAQELGAAGWRTAAFVSAPVVEAETGIARGFDRFDDGVSDGWLPAKSMPTSRLLRRAGLHDYPSVRPGAEVAERAAAWIEASGGERVFTWLHLFDSHAPYEASVARDCDHTESLAALTAAEIARYSEGHATPQWFAEHLHELYDGEVEQLDRQVGRIVQALERTGKLNSSLLVVLADHGESFDEPERFDHAGTLTEDTLRIPLIVRLPGVVEPGSRPRSLASVEDVHATLLEAAAIPGAGPPSSFSLLPPGENPVTLHTRRFTRHETHPHPMASSRERLVAIRTARSKLLIAPDREAREFFHLDEDPNLDRMNDTERHEDIEAMARWMDERGNGDSEALVAVDLIEDEETLEMLRSLGYVD